ncbi:hypothetical protein BD410DRAFT_807675 [Rickenella mellea]|uniref:Uncharacterized protein n=1 Tax=Rickenella mellea TaxID=50990 RepID=A0A4Y7PPS1_9AGAM|nr:hypothetical protein BD410DRAFT_807675 [Rickenella mellea]
MRAMGKLVCDGAVLSQTFLARVDPVDRLESLNRPSSDNDSISDAGKNREEDAPEYREIMFSQSTEVGYCEESSRRREVAQIIDDIVKGTLPFAEISTKSPHSRWRRSREDMRRLIGLRMGVPFLNTSMIMNHGPNMEAVESGKTTKEGSCAKKYLHRINARDIGSAIMALTWHHNTKRRLINKGYLAYIAIPDETEIGEVQNTSSGVCNTGKCHRAPGLSTALEGALAEGIQRDAETVARASTRAGELNVGVLYDVENRESYKNADVRGANKPREENQRTSGVGAATLQ